MPLSIRISKLYLPGFSNDVMEEPSEIANSQAFSFVNVTSNTAVLFNEDGCFFKNDLAS